MSSVNLTENHCPKVCFGIHYNLLSKLIGITFEVECFQFYYLNLRHLGQVRLTDKEIHNQVRSDKALRYTRLMKYIERFVLLKSGNNSLNIPTKFSVHTLRLFDSIEELIK